MSDNNVFDLAAARARRAAAAPAPAPAPTPDLAAQAAINAANAERVARERAASNVRTLRSYRIRP